MWIKNRLASYLSSEWILIHPFYHVSLHLPFAFLRRVVDYGRWLLRRRRRLHAQTSIIFCFTRENVIRVACERLLMIVRHPLVYHQVHRLDTGQRYPSRLQLFVLHVTLKVRFLRGCITLFYSRLHWHAFQKNSEKHRLLDLTAPRNQFLRIPVRPDIFSFQERGLRRRKPNTETGWQFN